MVQLRDDIVGLDAAILMAPEGLGGERPRRHVHRPARRLPQLQGAVPRRPPARVGRVPELRRQGQLHRGPQLQPDVQDVRRSGGETTRRSRTSGPRPRRASSSTSRTCRRPRARSRRSASRRSASRSATRSRPATSSSARASSSRWRWSTSCRPTTAPRWYEYWVQERYRWYIDLGIPGVDAAHPPARARGALALLGRHERPRVRVPVGLGRARGHREPHRLRPHPARQVLGRGPHVLRPGERRSTTCRT